MGTAATYIGTLLYMMKGEGSLPCVQCRHCDCPRSVRREAAGHRADPGDGLQPLGDGGQCGGVPRGHPRQHCLRQLRLPVGHCGDVLHHAHLGDTLLSVYLETAKEGREEWRDESAAEDKVSGYGLKLSFLLYY